jgi:DNA mismatch repair protein MutL
MIRYLTIGGTGHRANSTFSATVAYTVQLLQAAVEQAYRNTLLTGRFPACVVYLTLSFGAVDVNVHPAKTEVKFSDEKRVFDAVYYAVRGALEAEATVPGAHAAAFDPPPVSPPKIASAPGPRGISFCEPATHYQTRMDLTRNPSAPPDVGHPFAPSPRSFAASPAPAPAGPSRLRPRGQPTRRRRTPRLSASSGRRWDSISSRKRAARSF